MMRRWGSSLLLAGFALLGAGVELFRDAPVAALVVFVVLGGAAVAVSPRAFPRSVTDALARERSAADGRAIVYWRPGCPFCLRLRASLGRDARRLHWVDIWSDPAGAATVRAATGGDETVPTVVFAGEAHVNPAPARVRAMATR